MELIKILNPNNTLPEVYDSYRQTKTARALLLDPKGLIAIQYAGLNNFYKLPGGGVESGESIEQALRRELLEETGCEVEILGEVGRIVEVRDDVSKVKESFCYVCRVVGTVGSPNLTEYENEKKIETIWVSMAVAQDYLNDYIKIKDVISRTVQQRAATFLKCYLDRKTSDK